MHCVISASEYKVQAKVFPEENMFITANLVHLHDEE
jgi:hypothetical protein